jgi:F-type H+-transporting ATPase subunit a
MKSRVPSFILKISLIFFCAIALQMTGLQAQHAAEHAPNADESHGGHGAKAGVTTEDRVADVIIHHVMDNHDWHITDIGETEIALHLPWIVYNSSKGLDFFMNTHAMLEGDEHYLESHGNVYYVKSRTPIHTFNDLKNPAEKEELEKLEKARQGQVVVVHHTGVEVTTATGEKKEFEHAEVYELMEGTTVLDFSMTKTGLQILIVAIVMLLLFTSVARAYKKRDGMAPKGLQSFMEPLILFVRDDVAKPYLHGKHEKFVPYFLTLFFFIWISNLFGLTPLSSNIAGNTTITIMLAMITLILIIANSTKDFWMHILWFPGVPIWMKPLMFVVELMGFFTKPAALAIRLFANISAGHFMVLSLISLIFILGDNGRSIGGAVGIMPLSMAFSLFIFAVELIVAAVQAFVFSLLTAVFIGQAMETHAHDDHHDDGHH